MPNNKNTKDKIMKNDIIKICYQKYEYFLLVQVISIIIA